MTTLVEMQIAEFAARHLFVVNGLPGQANPVLKAWLAEFAGERVLWVRSPAPAIDVQYNAAVKAALARYEFCRFVFADPDIQPHSEHMAEFWMVAADIVGCRYPNGGEASWGPDQFHCGLWRTSRHVLAALAPPRFVWKYNADHTEHLECLCATFNRRVLAAGFTVATGGHAMHETREGVFHGPPIASSAL